jgi:hypothetical protein
MTDDTCSNSEVGFVYNHYNNYSQAYDYNQFEVFYAIIIVLMPISKRYSPYIKNDVVRRCH